MTTQLDKAIKREVKAGDQALILTLTPEGVTIVPKGKRKGKTFSWETLWSGEEEMAAQLRATYAALRPEGKLLSEPTGPNAPRNEKRNVRKAADRSGRAKPRSR
jgi:hypothetical protein